MIYELNWVKENCLCGLCLFDWDTTPFIQDYFIRSVGDVQPWSRGELYDGKPRRTMDGSSIQGVMIPYAFIRPLLLYVVGPLAVLAFVYFKGYSAGAEKVRAEALEAQKQIAGSLRKAEEKNAEIRYEQEKENIKIRSNDLAYTICMFNAYFSGTASVCNSKKAGDPEN